MRACVINLLEYAEVGTNWIALYLLDNNAIYFDGFGIEHVTKEIRNKHFNRNKNMQIKLYRIQESNSIMCGYIYDIYLSYIDYPNLFLPYVFKKNDKIILNYIKKV